MTLLPDDDKQHPLTCVAIAAGNKEASFYCSVVGRIKSWGLKKYQPKMSSGCSVFVIQIK